MHFHAMVTISGHTIASDIMHNKRSKFITFYERFIAVNSVLT